MTFDKMLRVLEQLKGEHGQVGVSTGSELTIEPTSQLSKTNHVWLLKRGFVYVDTLYIYRPRS